MEESSKNPKVTISGNQSPITAAQFTALWKVSDYLQNAGFDVTMTDLNVVEDVVIGGDADLKVVRS